MRHPSRLASLAVAAVLAMTAAACNSAADEPPGMQQGGTLRVAVNALPTRLDPQRISAALDANVSRLITRTLTTFKSEPGRASGELASDLATDLGRPSENNTVWEFRLRDGVKWADGSAITCQHVKYGAERNYATLSPTACPTRGPTSRTTRRLTRGPFIGGNDGLDSVAVHRHQDHPVQAEAAGRRLQLHGEPAGLRAGQAGRGQRRRGLQPRAAGQRPVQGQAGQPDRDRDDAGAQRALGRATPTRSARPTRTRSSSRSRRTSPALTNALIEDQGEARDTISLNQDVAPNFVQQVMTDTALSVADRGRPVRRGAVHVASTPSGSPNEKCRQALIYAFNKRKFRQAMGGSLLGELATTMIPPTLRGVPEVRPLRHAHQRRRR